MQNNQGTERFAIKPEHYFFLQLKDEIESLFKQTEEFFIGQVIEKFLHHKVFKNGKPLFASSDDPQFKAFIAICQLYAGNKKFPLLLRIKIANIAAMAYISVIPQHGLPLTHPCVQGALTWYQKVIHSQENNLVAPELYVDSCQYIAGLYERRLKDNPNYRQLAMEYFSLGLKAVYKLRNMRATQAYLWDYANFLYRLLPADATLINEDVQRTLQAYLKHEQYCMKASKMLNKLDRDAHQSKVYIRQKYFNLFSGKWYFWNECVMLGCIQRAKIYFCLPAKPKGSPDYQTVVNLLMRCRSHQDPFVQATIHSEELRPYIAELPRQRI
jgi:hypothetical protein